MNQRLNRLCGIIVLGTISITVLSGQDRLPSSTVREYIWTPEDALDEGKFLRVGGKLDYKTTPDHFPSDKHLDGWITMAQSIDLKMAIRAELILERIQSHGGTKGLKVQINEGEWMEVTAPATIPEPKETYMFDHLPIINISLNRLKDGDPVKLRFKVSEVHSWNWPQNLIYGATLRIYYDSEKCDEAPKIISLSEKDVLDEKTLLSIGNLDFPNVLRVDYIGFYEDVNWQGDGIYLQWQYIQHRGKLAEHIGSSQERPFSLLWNTSWLPDQLQPIRIMAKITYKDSLIQYTYPVSGLTLNRKYSVALVKPYEVPANWVTREGDFSEKLQISNIDKILEARIFWKSWSPCYNEGIRINNRSVRIEDKGPCYDYSRRELSVAPEFFIEGENTISTLKTPLHDGHMVHGMEVQWPGIMVKIKYDSLIYDVIGN